MVIRVQIEPLVFFSIFPSYQAMLLENMINLFAACTPLLYRVSNYIALSLLDDPAMLAMAFC